MPKNVPRETLHIFTWLIFIGLLVLASAVVSYQYLDRGLAFWVQEDFSRDIQKWAGWYTSFGHAGFWLKWLGIVGIVAVAALVLPPIAKRYSMRRSQAWRNQMGRFAWHKLLGWVTLAFAAVAASGIFINLVKIIVARQRPVILFDENQFGFVWFSVSYGNNSFPSGHAATAGAIMTVAILAWPRLNVLWLILGITLMLSRVFVTAHYLSDVIVGGYIGVVIAILLAMLWQRKQWIYAGFKSV